MIMDTIVGDFYIAGDVLQRSVDNNRQFDPDNYRFYEVLRIVEGVPLFLEDHAKRLRKALDTVNCNIPQADLRIKRGLSEIIIANHGLKGNAKLLCNPENNSLKIAAYYIPHRYPTEEEYRKGIAMMTYRIERPEPNLKQTEVSNLIGKTIKQVFKASGIFEVLLLNHKNLITEGSRSNIFLIKDQVLYSAPDELILKGITREYVLAIARDEKIRVEFKKIRADRVGDFDSAFICGTSNKILPVNRINNICFHPDNLITRKIMEEYDRKINEYLECKRD